MKKTMIAATILIILVVACVLFNQFYAAQNNDSPPLPDNEPPNTAMSSDPIDDSETSLSVQEMRADLDYLVTTLEQVHPSLINGWNKEQRKTIDTVYNQLNAPLTKDQFYYYAIEIITLLQDAHSFISPYSNSTKSLSMSVYWTEEGPVVLNSTLNLQRGDLLISLGGLKSQELVSELKKVISAENEEWVKMRGSGVMITDSFLKHLNLVKEDTVEISVKRNGKILSLNLPFNKKNVQESMNTPFDTGNGNYSYTINEDLSLGILQINACIFDEEYKNTLQNFFAEVNQLKINHVAVDLRNNTGGDSRVIDEFLRYVNVDKFTTFSGLVRFSPQAKELRNGDLSSGFERFPSTEMKNTDQVSSAFSGKLYALTSAKTFSSGNMFAVMLQDNKIGTIIGEPTGNQPSAYGDILGFSLPHSQFQFSLSYKQFLRPNEQLNDQLTLEPDIPVYTTRQDIIDGRDAQLSKLEEMIKTEQ